jgi:hypothetical protein
MKFQLKLIIQVSLIVGFLAIFVFNIFTVKKYQDPLNKYKLMVSSMSHGDSYYGRLQMWYYFAKLGDWSTAAKLEPNLEQVDYLDYKINHQPEMLQKQIDTIVTLKDKTINDYIELAQLYAQKGDNKAAFNAIKEAHTLDPIRTDIEKLYFTFLPFSHQ